MAIGKKNRKKTKQMVDMLPNNGLRYEYEDKQDENGKPVRSILPARMSTKIMNELHKKYKKPTKKDFDHAIAKLFDNASPMVVKLAGDGKKPEYDIDYWHTPKVGTIFENVSDKTTFRFAVKMLEGRDRWLDIERKRAQDNPNYKPSDFERETAKAIDRFNGWVEAANLAGTGNNAHENGKLPGTYDFSKKPYLADGFDPNEDTDPSLDSDGEPTDNDEKPTDDEAPTAKRVKLEMPPTNDGKDGPNFAPKFGTAPLAIRTRAPPAEPQKDMSRTDAKKLEMPFTTDGTAGPKFAPRFGNVSLGVRLGLAARFAEPFKGPKKPDPEWDALLARTSKPYGTHFNLDEDADLMDM